MSNGYYATLKSKWNANTNVNNQNKQSQQVGLLLETGVPSSSSFNTTNPRFSGNTEMFDATITNNVAVNGNIAVGGTASFDGNVTFRGQVNGVSFNGVVSEITYAQDQAAQERTNNALYSGIATAASANAANTRDLRLIDSTATDAKGRLTIVEDLAASIPTLNTDTNTLKLLVGDPTSGLVKDNTINKQDIATLKLGIPQLADARSRLVDLESNVNGDSSLGKEGLIRNMSNVQQRMNSAEQDLVYVKGKIDGEGSLPGLTSRMTSAEAILSNLDQTVQTKINAVVDGAPDSLNTLNEIARELNQNSDTTIVGSLFHQIGTKANSTDVVKLNPGSGNSQTIQGNVNFVGTVSGISANMVSASTTVDPSDTTSVAARLSTAVDIASAQRITGKKEIANQMLFQDASKIIFGTWTSYSTLEEKLSSTNISQTQNFTNGLKVPSFSLITLTDNGSMSVGSELDAKLDVRSAAGTPWISSSPVFKESGRIENPSRFYLGTSNSSTLQTWIDKTANNESTLSSLDSVVVKKESNGDVRFDGNKLLVSYVNDAQASTSNTLLDFAVNTKTKQVIGGDKIFADRVVSQLNNLIFRVPANSDSATETSLESLLSRTTLCYLDGDAQTITGAKTFQGRTELAVDQWYLRRPDVSNPSISTSFLAKDFMVNTVDDQSVAGWKTFSTGVRLSDASKLSIQNISASDYFVTAAGALAQTITGTKTMGTGAKWRIVPSSLKLMLSGITSDETNDVAASDYWTTTSTQQTISGKKIFTGGNGIVVDPSTLLFQNTGAGSDQTAAQYLVNRLDDQTVAGVKTFSSGIVFPMDTTQVKTDANASTSTSFASFVVNRSEEQTISGKKTFTGPLVISPSNLQFAGSTPTATLADLISTTSLLYVNGDQSVKGNKTFELGGKVTIAPSDLQLKVDGQTEPVGSQNYFVTLGGSSAQILSGDKQFDGVLKVDPSKLQLKATATTSETTLQDVLARTNLLYLGGTDTQVITGTKSFTGTVIADATKLKVKMNSSETDSTAKTLSEQFVNTTTAQDIYGDKTFKGKAKVNSADLTLKMTKTTGAEPVTLTFEDSVDSLLVDTKFDQTIDGQKTFSNLRVSGSGLLISSSTNSWTDGATLIDELQTTMNDVSTINSRLDTLSSQAALATTAVQTSSTSSQTVSTPLSFTGNVQIPAANLQLTSFSASPTSRTADNLAFLNGPNTQVFTNGFTVNSGNVTLIDASSASLSTVLATKVNLSTSADQTLDHVVQVGGPSYSKVILGSNKRLQVPESNLWISNRALGASDATIADYVDSRADTRIAANTPNFVKAKDARVAFTVDSGTQKVVMSSSTSLYISDASKLIFGSDLSGTTDTLGNLLNQKQAAGNYLVASDLSPYSTTTTANGMYYQKSATSMAIPSTMPLTVSSSTTFENSVTCQQSLRVNRIIETRAFPEGASDSGNTVTVNYSNGSVFLLSTATDSTNFKVNIQNFPLNTASSPEQAISIALLIPFNGSFRRIASSFAWSNGTTGFTDASVVYANGFANIDLSNSTYVMQTATFSAKGDNTTIFCQSAVAPYW